MTKPVKLSAWGAVLVLLPFTVFVGATSYTAVNGEVTEYSYLNLAAIGGGIAAVCVGFALLRGNRPG